MRFPARKIRRPNIHLTALIDIVFLLLIFFLLSSSFVHQQGIQILVPEVEIESKDRLPELTVKIEHECRIYEKEVFSGYQNDNHKISGTGHLYSGRSCCVLCLSLHFPVSYHAFVRVVGFSERGHNG